MSKITVTIERALGRLLMRLASLKPGRYLIILDLGGEAGPTWTISRLGKIERGLRADEQTMQNDRTVI